MSITGTIFIGLILAISIRALFYGFRAVALGKRAVPSSQSPVTPHKRVLILGDSIAVGVGASAPETSLVGRLIQSYPHLHIDNRAKNALGFNEVEQVLANITDETYDIVILSVGGMDVLRCTPFSSIAKHVARIQEHLHRLGVHQTILVSVNNVGNAPMWGFPLNRFFDRRSRNLTEHLATLSVKYNILHVPLYREKYTDPLIQQPNLFAEDGTHPNDQGYAIWYNHIQSIIHPHMHHD